MHGPIPTCIGLGGVFKTKVRRGHEVGKEVGNPRSSRDGLMGRYDQSTLYTSMQFSQDELTKKQTILSKYHKSFIHNE